MTNNSSQQRDQDIDNAEGLDDGMKRMLKGLNNLTNISLLPKQMLHTNFFVAVKRNAVEEVRKILDTPDFDPNIFNGQGQTALHVAAINNAVAATQLLLEHGANPRLGQKDKPEHTPLEDAVTFNKPEIVGLLARYGSYTPGQKVNGWSLLHRACEKGKTAIVEMLLRAGADCNETTENGATPLIIAIQRDRVDLAKTLLKFTPVLETMNAYVVKTDEKKRNAFYMAVERGNMPLIASMIEKGAEVNSRDAEDKSVLLSAIGAGNLKLVQLLAESGADLNADSQYGTPLVHAARAADLDSQQRQEMIELLIQLGANPDIPSPGQNMSPLHLLIQSKQEPEVLQALLRYPINKEICDITGDTPLLYAVGSRDEYLPQLLAAGADPNGRHAVDAKTPLILAAKQGKLDCVKMLLQAGANPKLLDAYSKSALSYAREKQQTEIVAVLEQALMKARSTPKPPSL